MSLDVVRSILQFNSGRDPERLAIKYQRMRADAFAFLRGSCHLFYDRLPAGGLFKSAPPVWVCGDLHLENFGSYKGDNRVAYFDLNDFDEAALAPASWDLARFLTSLIVAAGTGKAARLRADLLCHAFLDHYRHALALGKAGWVERETASGLVRQLLDGVRERQRLAFLNSRSTLHGRRRRLKVDGVKALPVSAAQRQRVTGFMDAFAQAQPDPAFYKSIDVVRRISGLGSLGLERYAVLVRGKGSPDRNYLLDLKRALPSSLVPHLKLRQPAWPSEAHRVVGVQRRVQAVSMAFLEPVSMQRHPFVLRALQPTEDRVALSFAAHKADEMAQLMATMGRVVAWAHLRGAGRDGSAIADELISWAGRAKWPVRLVDAAQHCAVQVLQDAATFNAAYDDRAFDV